MRRSLIPVALLLSSLAACASAQIAPAPSNRFFFALSVPDVEASAKWYRATLGLSLERDNKAEDGSAHIIILGSPHLAVELVQHRDATPDAGPVDQPSLKHGLYKVGVYVSDLPALVARLKQNGVSFRYDLIEDPEMGLRTAIIRDNAGNLIQLFESIGERR